RHVVREGEVEVVYEDRDSASRLRHFLNVPGRRIELHFADDPPRGLRTGSRVRVEGDELGDILALTSVTGSVQTISVATLPSNVGEKKVAVILVNFRDDP